MKVGSYRIESRLGSGGMGVVYRAFDETLQRPVAIKHLLADPSHPTASRRFRREAMVAARLNHPAIVHIYDVAETEEGDWIVMELIEGQTLDAKIQDGALDLAQAVRLGKEIAEGLAEAHAQGIIHRDLKASNVMVTPSGRAKILDFGLAKLVRHGGESELSQAGTLLGTCHAMSPEQIEGVPLDHRSDLFSLGSLLYEMLTGVSPFRAPGMTETLTRICRVQQLPACVVRPEIPTELSDLLDQLLQKDPSRRPRGAGEVARFLEGLERAGLSSPSPVAPTVSWTELSGEHTLVDAPPARWRPRLDPVSSLPSAALDSSRPAGERRQVTVLCCELVNIDGAGAATLRRADPEVFYEMMLQLRALATAVVGRYDGHLGSILGHRLLIYFGYPQAHEDNARRAVQAALDLVTRAAQMEPSIDKGEAVRPALRVGIHTGPAVVATSPEAREPVTLGATLDLALELQALAEPGGVVVSPATGSIIRKSFALEPLAPVRLTGQAEPLVPHRVLDAVDAPEVGVASLLPLVGRQQELELLLSRWSLAREGRGQVVLISGEAGMGKSRLVLALRDSVDDQAAQWLSCYGSPDGQNSPLQPVVRLLRRAIALQEGGSPLDQLANLLRSYGLDEALPLLASLLALPLDGRWSPPVLPPDRQKESTLEALVALMLEMAERQPLVLLIEDLHWLDPTTIAWLDRLIDQAPTVPLFLVMTLRLQTVEALWGPRAHLTQITLSPLTGAEAEKLIDRVIGGKNLPDKLRRQIVARTDGVPLFLEELTKTVLESEDTGQRELPATLRDSLAARLDRLGTAKEVAQLASVIGRSFSLELLAAVSSLPEVALQRELRHLVQAELIYRKGFGSQARYFFKHALVQDAAYESLLKKEQQQIHTRIAQALEAYFPEAAEAQPEILAHHYTEGNDPKTAVPYWYKAGQKALERSANLEAIHHLENGVALLDRMSPNPERDEQDLRFQASLLPAVIATKGFTSPEVERAYRRGLDLCERLGAPNFQLLWGLFAFYSVRREADKALDLGHQMLKLAQDQENVAFIFQSHYGLAGTCFVDGDLLRSHEHVQAALALAESDIGDIARTLTLSFGTDDRKVVAAYEGPLLWLLGFPDQARERSQAAIAWAREEPNPFTLSTVLLLSCFLHLFRKEELFVLTYAQEMSVLSEEHKLFQTRDANVMLGCAQVEDPAGEEWIDRLRESIEIYRASGFQVFLSFYLAQLAAACLRFGRLEECATALDEALRLSQQNKELFWAPEIHRLRGDLALASTEKETAESAYLQAFETADRQSAKSLRLRAAVSLARLWADRQETTRARDLLSRSFESFSEGHDTADLKEAATLLAALA